MAEIMGVALDPGKSNSVFCFLIIISCLSIEWILGFKRKTTLSQKNFIKGIAQLTLWCYIYICRYERVANRLQTLKSFKKVVDLQ